MRVLWISAVIVLVDQITKVLVRVNMHGRPPSERSIPILGEWFRLTYTENAGMAFGITFGPRGLVTFLSIAATVLIVVYLWQVRHGYRPYVVSLALILGGAVGNIIDRVFYGVIFGYDGLFTGKVVDFIHLDVYRGTVQDLLPFIGGAPFHLSLFPIGNVADVAIIAGVLGILVFQNRYHDQLIAEQQAAEEAPPAGAPPATAPAEPVVVHDPLAARDAAGGEPEPLPPTDGAPHAAAPAPEPASPSAETDTPPERRA